MAEVWKARMKGSGSQPSAVQGSWNWSRRRRPLELQLQLSTGGFPNISKISVSLSKVWRLTALHWGTVMKKSSLAVGVPSDLLSWKSCLLVVKKTKKQSVCPLPTPQICYAALWIWQKDGISCIFQLNVYTSSLMTANAWHFIGVYISPWMTDS